MKSTKQALAKAGWVTCGAVLIGLASAPAAHGQLGIDTAAILAGLTALNSTITSVIQAPMSILQQSQQSEQQFMSTTVFPQTSIASAQSSATQASASATQSQAVIDTTLNSAQNANQQQLETVILSRNPNQVGNVASNYQQVFGALPTTTQLPANYINAVDMGDAAAMESLKKSIILDSLADREMEISQQLLSELTTATPGSAPMISAQAEAWILQGRGYSQAGLAQSLRADSAILAYQGLHAKNAATASQAGSGMFAPLGGAN